MNKTKNNTQIKCLITDFDETFFRTAIAADLKKTKPILHRKPHARNLEKALDALGLQKDEVISVGNSTNDFLQAQKAGVRFVGACWDSLHTQELKQLGETADSPLDLIEILSKEINPL